MYKFKLIFFKYTLSNTKLIKIETHAIIKSMKFLSIKVPKTNEILYPGTLAVINSLTDNEVKEPSFLDKILNKKITEPDIYSLNVLSIQQRIHFIVGAPENKLKFLSKQFLGQYNRAEISVLKSLGTQSRYFKQLQLNEPNYLPIKTIDKFEEVDPLASLLTSISHNKSKYSLFWIQIILQPASTSWQENATKFITNLQNSTKSTNSDGQTVNKPLTEKDKNRIELVQEKLKYFGFKTNIRLITDSQANLKVLSDAMQIYSQVFGNRFVDYKPDKSIFNRFTYNQEELYNAINRHIPYGERMVLNSLELSSVWHLPNIETQIPSIVWGGNLILEPPENLPVADKNMSKEEKDQLTFFAKTRFKGEEKILGLRRDRDDRFRHVYIIGKSGTGKTSMIENMAIDDIRKGEGVGILDPHGDLAETIIDYIPKNRINDVCFFNPADKDYTYPLNPLEVTNPEQRELIASGILSIFKKLYHYSWGPRLEHIFRNTLLTLVAVEKTTLVDVVRILTDENFRRRTLKKVDDTYLIEFWENEFEQMHSREMQIAISPILNKVGQFVSSPIIRKVIKWPYSRIDIQDIMNNKKILICDLSQGKLGEDNSTLLGSMIITQIQVAAMNRAFKPMSERVPFLLYVDEFQNFATESFTKILSEARKYKLALTLANQYVNQIDEDVTNAILGNVGTLINLSIGAQDAEILQREYGNEVEAEDLTSLEKYQVILRMSLDNKITPPFSAYTLPLPKNVSNHRDKIIKQSRMQFGLELKEEDGKSR